MRKLLQPIIVLPSLILIIILIAGAWDAAEAIGGIALTFYIIVAACSNKWLFWRH